MKSAAQAIQQKYYKSGEVERNVYFSFSLMKYAMTLDPNVEHPKTMEEIGFYEFGDALKHDYAFYEYKSDIATAQNAWRALQSQLSEDDYKDCGQTLVGVETAFKNLFNGFGLNPYFVSDENDNNLKNACDEIITTWSARMSARSAPDRHSFCRLRKLDYLCSPFRRHGPIQPGWRNW